VYILADVSRRLGEATEKEVRLELEGLGDADFIAKGRLIGTPRLVKELARNYGHFAASLERATEAQLGQLGFINEDWLRLAAWSARQAELMHEAYQRGAQGGTAGKQVRGVEAEELTAGAKRARDRLRNTLQYLSGQLPTWKTKIQTAYSTSVTTAPIADSILAMADVAEAMLADRSPGMTARRKRTALTAASVEEHRELAKKLAAAVKAARAVRKAAAVTRSEVDLWDGIAITFFEQFVDTVEDAHEEDPRVPAPSILGLRSWFHGPMGRRNALVARHNPLPGAPQPLTGRATTPFAYGTTTFTSGARHLRRARTARRRAGMASGGCHNPAAERHNANVSWKDAGPSLCRPELHA
jgi:hypothetical protein